MAERSSASTILKNPRRDTGMAVLLRVQPVEKMANRRILRPGGATGQWESGASVRPRANGRRPGEGSKAERKA